MLLTGVMTLWTVIYAKAGAVIEDIDGEVIRRLSLLNASRPLRSQRTVLIHLRIHSIGAVDAFDKSLGVLLSLYEEWPEPGLGLAEDPIPVPHYAFHVHASLAHHLWQPRTHFVLGEELNEATPPVLRIDRTGTVARSRKLLIRLHSLSAIVEHYPFHIATATLDIASRGDPSDVLSLEWAEAGVAADRDASLSFAEHRLAQLRSGANLTCSVSDELGDASCVRLELELSHSFRGLLHRFFLPAALALALSWPSHLLSRQRYPQLGFTLSLVSLALVELQILGLYARRELWRSTFWTALDVFALLLRCFCVISFVLNVLALCLLSKSRSWREVSVKVDWAFALVLPLAFALIAGVYFAVYAFPHWL